MIYDLVPFQEIAEDVAKNAETHYADMGIKEGYGRPDLDWEMYLQMSLAGRCVAVTARDKGELKAYSVFLLSNNLHYKKFIEAMSTGFFIDKDYRGKITSEFIKKCDELLERIGVMQTSYSLSDDRLGRLFERVGYKASNIIWSKRYVTFFDTITNGNG